MNPLGNVFFTENLLPTSEMWIYIVVVIFWLFLLTISYIYLFGSSFPFKYYILSIYNIPEAKIISEHNPQYIPTRHTLYICYSCLPLANDCLHSYIPILCNICGHLVDVIEDIVSLRFIAKRRYVFRMRFVLRVLRKAKEL